MSPRKQPNSLFKLCVKSCISLINSACSVIEKTYPEDEYYMCEQALMLKCHLMTLLPARLFDVLCAHRGSVPYRGDPRAPLLVLTHPRLATFRKADLDHGVAQRCWLQLLPALTQLVVLDLKLICTDEILQVVGATCHLLEEINIVSRVDICKSPFNASALIRNVSDAGLAHVARLRRLRVVALDPPRNERARRVGRCVSPRGLLALAAALPALEDLRVESCDLGSTLAAAERPLPPLALRRINCHSASADGVRKLIKICPHLRELSVTHLSEHNKDPILEEIAASDLRLQRLDLSFFSFSAVMQRLLAARGAMLTHFSLWELDSALTLPALEALGAACPRLAHLTLITQSRCLAVPRYYRRERPMFTELRTLTIGNENFNIRDILTFFLSCTRQLHKLVLKYQTKVNIDDTIVYILERGYLSNISYMWLDCTLEVSPAVVRRLVDRCADLRELTVDVPDLADVQRHIHDNNLDLKLGSY
ncbi:hypothetical protein JYU34_012305 [Plutella xylostella]|uniref:Uncharacterized protein n=1 Tax=Plutella xylostella TaxID=51655 RepID=A0ABQ7QET8_PLUXY|nr:hypothetical protein JYU34_022809 [Plutella xylostella]KAG7303737.1 hypothetical protein JYU34_012305 [Plutella xylostella]